MDSSLNQFKIVEVDNPKLSRDEEDRKILNGYVFMHTLGRGSYSKVKMAVKEGKKFAVKILNKRLLRKKTKGYGKDNEGNLKVITMIEDAENEIDIYRIMPQNCDRIVKLYQIINDLQSDKTYLIMEYCELGPVMRLNERNGKFLVNSNFPGEEFTENQLKVFIKNIAEGINYCKSFRIIE